jgi:hypothetical protein
MRSSSVISSARSSLAAAAVVVVLAASAHAAPAENRSTHRSDAIRTETGIERVVRIVKHFLGISGQSDVISIPTPPPPPR